VSNGPTLEDAAVSEPGRLIIERCMRHMQLNYPQGAVILAGVGTRLPARNNAFRQVLAKAGPGAFAPLVCASSHVYDAAFPPHSTSICRP
jgi:hypothetical protein